MNSYRWLRYKLRYELAAFIKEKQFGYGAEIDVKGGQPFITILKKNPQLYMVGVDTWDTRTAVLEKKCRERCRPYGQRARLVKGDASRVAFGFSKGAFDFVFYNCNNHCAGTVEYHKKILQPWVHKIKDGGYLLSCGFNEPAIRTAMKMLGLNDVKPLTVRGKESAVLKYVQFPLN